jgi:hypothetical protein
MLANTLAEYNLLKQLLYFYLNKYGRRTVGLRLLVMIVTLSHLSSIMLSALYGEESPDRYNQLTPL